ncbi:hypothetical protein Fcan01_02017 [Folsomia candida]|uniref:Gustatory receptor n=1 Tax=Folsomia candida TaxID=158441 RepID=A0A226EX80_FOLCA|nr:hypothetical protein Fcan01_02017 [Folsomia candida]
MKSFGFFSCIWLGWILGFLQLSPPWRDPPSFNSWKSWISVWSLIVLCVQHVLLIDFSRQTKLVDGLAVNLLAKQLHALMFIVTFGAFWTVRVIFLIRAKKLAKLLGAFYVYPIKNEYFRWRVAWRVAVFFVCISGILVISSSGLFVLAVRSKSRAADSPPWFFIFGKVLSGILSAFFGHMASMASTNVAFALVIYISFYLEFVIVRDANSKKLNFLHSPLSKEILLNKFEGIRTLFEEGNKIIAPLALVVIVVETFRGVSGAHELLINKLGGFFALDNYLNVIQQLIHAGLVFVGQYVVDKMNERKQQLSKIIALMEETDSNHKFTVKLVNYVIDFDWKLSGYGFFYVDKKLLSGMVATAMTYIVILVQLQISLHSPACRTSFILSTINGTEIG